MPETHSQERLLPLLPVFSLFLHLGKARRWMKEAGRLLYAKIKDKEMPLPEGRGSCEGAACRGLQSYS
jgi:hypothetical protein